MATGFDRDAASKVIVSILCDALGGEGWDNPELPRIVDGWLEWPFLEQTVDIAYCHSEADALIDAGFDPRHLARSVQS